MLFCSPYASDEPFPRERVSEKTPGELGSWGIGVLGNQLSTRAKLI